MGGRYKEIQINTNCGEVGKAYVVNCFVRGNQAQNKDNPFVNHCQEYNMGEEQEVVFKLSLI